MENSKSMWTDDLVDARKTQNFVMKDVLSLDYFRRKYGGAVLVPQGSAIDKMGVDLLFLGGIQSILKSADVKVSLRSMIGDNLKRRTSMLEIAQGTNFERPGSFVDKTKINDGYIAVFISKWDGPCYEESDFEDVFRSGDRDAIRRASSKVDTPKVGYEVSADEILSHVKEIIVIIERKDDLYYYLDRCFSEDMQKAGVRDVRDYLSMIAKSHVGLKRGEKTGVLAIDKNTGVPIYGKRCNTDEGAFVLPLDFSIHKQVARDALAIDIENGIVRPLGDFYSSILPECISYDEYVDSKTVQSLEYDEYEWT